MFKFYEKNKEIYLKDVLEFLSKDSSNVDENIIIENISPIDKAKENDLVFVSVSRLSGEKYLDIIKNLKAKCCLVTKDIIDKIPSNIIAIEVENPYVSFIELYEKFYRPIKFEKKISSSAIIHPSASISDICQIEDGAVIGANVTIANYVRIEKNVIIDSNSSLQFCTIGENSHIGYGARIGQDGFGFMPLKKNGFPFIFKIPHFGGVEIGVNCSIGANTCIDRGNFDNTVIGSSVKIDNLVQVAHNVQIGNYTMIAGQAGVAGSAKIGNGVLIGAKSGVVGHITIGDNSIIYAGSGVTKSFEPNSKIFAGWPADLYEEWLKKVIFFNVLYKKAFQFKLFLKKKNFIAKVLNFLIKKIR